MAEPQWPHPWPYTEHCVWHDAHEPAAGAFIVCGECGHAFRTSEELANTYIANAPEGTTPLVPDPIPFCPHCLHDF